MFRFGRRGRAGEVTATVMPAPAACGPAGVMAPVAVTPFAATPFVAKPTSQGSGSVMVMGKGSYSALIAQKKIPQSIREDVSVVFLNIIAHNLLARGVKPNDIVALMLPRQSHLISAIMGVMKSGAAYLPIDPDYAESITREILWYG